MSSQSNDLFHHPISLWFKDLTIAKLNEQITKYLCALDGRTVYRGKLYNRSHSNSITLSFEQTQHLNRLSALLEQEEKTYLQFKSFFSVLNKTDPDNALTLFFFLSNGELSEEWKTKLISKYKDDPTFKLILAKKLLRDMEDA